MNINMNMSYHEANLVFENASDQQKREYLKHFPISPVIDVRGKCVPTSIINQFIFQKSFIVIDGVSGSGKSTLGQKIKKRYGDLVEILDIDKLCIDWIQEKKNELSEIEFLKVMCNFDKATDQYISENLEELIVKKSENGNKAVVLIGSYLWIIARTIVMHTLGKYFKYSVMITLHENFDVIKKRIQNTRNNFGIVKAKQEHDFMEGLIKENINYLGIGDMYVSFLADMRTDWGL